MNYSVKIIADSINDYENRLTTFELQYPRFIHAELGTHRLFSRNSSSSRAIPTDKFIDFLTAEPVYFGINKAGMAAEEELSDELKVEFLEEWFKLRDINVMFVKQWKGAFNLHKQIANRVLEPWFIMKTIVSATNFDNFFWLRSHPAAQPEIKVLSDMMLEEYNNSTPKLVLDREWHLPYITEEIDFNDLQSVKDAIKISLSCCAQVSYRNNDLSLEKAQLIYDKLLVNEPIHASPAEHVATPLGYYEIKAREELAATLNDPGIEYCGNFKGWKQYRKLLKNESKNL